MTTTAPSQTAPHRLHTTQTVRTGHDASNPVRYGGRRAQTGTDRPVKACRDGSARGVAYVAGRHGDVRVWGLTSLVFKQIHISKKRH